MQSSDPKMDDDSGSDLDIDMDSLPLELREALFPTEAATGGYNADEIASDSSFDTDSSDEEMNEIFLTGDRDKDRQSLLALMGDSDDEDGMAARGGIKSKNEISPDEIMPDPVPMVVDLSTLKPAGNVLSIVNNTFVVQASVQGSALDLNNPLFNSSGHPVGRVEDVFGNVNEPFYVVRPAPLLDQSNDSSSATVITTTTTTTNTSTESNDNTPSDVDADQKITPQDKAETTQENAKPAIPSCPVIVTEGEEVFYITDSRFVLPSEIYVPGCDASNPNDEAADDNEVEFSDDEKEMQYKRDLKAKRATNKQATKPNDNSNPSSNPNGNESNKKRPHANKRGPRQNSNAPHSHPAQMGHQQPMYGMPPQHFNQFNQPGPSHHYQQYPANGQYYPPGPPGPPGQYYGAYPPHGHQQPPMTSGSILGAAPPQFQQQPYVGSVPASVFGQPQTATVPWLTNQQAPPPPPQPMYPQHPYHQQYPPQDPHQNNQKY